MNYRLTINIAHCKIISKALHLLKMIYKGDLTFVLTLLDENQKTLEPEYPDFLEKTSLAKDRLKSIESKYIQKYNSMLLIGERGFSLSAVKKKFIDAGLTIKLKKYEKYEIIVSQNDLDIIINACELYCDLQCGKFTEIFYKFNEVKKYPEDLLNDFEDLELSWYNIKVSDVNINRKSKWCFDIGQTLRYKDKHQKLIGTLPRIKIIKNESI
jgi:hypothetical protein